MNDNNASNLIKAAIAGAAVGAAAVVLSDKKKRDQLKKKIVDLKLRANEKLKEMQTDTQKKVEKGKIKIAKKLKDAGDTLENVQVRTEKI